MNTSPVLTLLLFLVLSWTSQINGLSWVDRIMERHKSPKNSKPSPRQHDGPMTIQTPIVIDFNNFPSLIRAGDYYKQMAEHGFPPARYIWPSTVDSDVLFLHCYMGQDPSSKQKLYIAVIKALENKAVFSVLGFRCLPESDLYENHYIRVEKNGNKRTFYIGVRISEQEWRRAVICVDCGDSEGKPDQGDGQQGEFIHWSRGAVEWKRGVTEDYIYSQKNVAKQFVSTGNTKFVLVCINDGTEHTGQVVRSASGAFIVKVNFIFDCKATPNLLILQIFFVTESSDGRLSLLTAQDCINGCQVDVGGDIKKSWLYFYELNTRLKNYDQSVPFAFLLRDNDGVVGKMEPNSCNNFKKTDIQKTQPYDQSKSSPLAMYSAGGNFKIACYKVSLPARTAFYANILFNDKIVLSFANFNCKTHLSSGTTKRFIATTNNDADVSQVVVGSYDPQWTNSWCVYNVIKMPDSDTYDIELYYGYNPDPSVLRWVTIK